MKFELPLGFPQDLRLKIRQNRNFRALKMRFDRLNGILILNIPYYTTQSALESFLKQHLEWIKNLHNKPRESLLQDNKIFCFGEWMEPVEFEEMWFEIGASKIEALDEISEAILKGQYEHLMPLVYYCFLNFYIQDSIKRISNIMQTPEVKVCYGKGLQRLGCCYASLKKIRFSVQIVFFPKFYIDSVIIHELAHLTHQDHSASFWNLVYKYDKNADNLKIYLRENNPLLTELYGKFIKNAKFPTSSLKDLV
ncbi:MAG: DUF45 domain-containing protein [Helicobacteraceae bacterium]|nr:DUF45 domain-containing protein [Helicobacteraceae bacterium]